MDSLQKVTVYGVILGLPDGRVEPIWFKNRKDAEIFECGNEEEPEYQWSEPSLFEVETFVGSSIYSEAR